MTLRQKSDLCPKSGRIIIGIVHRNNMTTNKTKMTDGDQAEGIHMAVPRKITSPVLLGNKVLTFRKSMLEIC